MFQVVGCSHHFSDLRIREKLAFNKNQASEFLSDFYTIYPDSEAVLLSTCNRTEFYVASRNSAAVPDIVWMKSFLASQRGLNANEIRRHLFVRNESAAIQHLFAVASSLDSMVVGETQILGQVKRAYRLAVEIKPSVPFVHMAFQAAIKVARRVTNETGIHRNRLSIPGVAIGGFARQKFKQLDDKKILVIGAGEMATETLKYVIDYGGRDITVINRTYQVALQLAERCKGHAVSWERLTEQLTVADLVISTTTSNSLIVTDELYQQIELTRKQRPFFVLDLAVPRDFDHRISKRPNVFIYSLDELKAECRNNRLSRQKHLPAAMRIVDKETDRFIKAMASRAAFLRRYCEDSPTAFTAQSPLKTG